MLCMRNHGCITMGVRLVDMYNILRQITSTVTMVTILLKANQDIIW